MKTVLTNKFWIKNLEFLYEMSIKGFSMNWTFDKTVFDEVNAINWIRSNRKLLMHKPRTSFCFETFSVLKPIANCKT
jgi:hypothetical protein